MAMFVEVVNTAPIGDVTILVQGDHVIVKAGETVKVPPEVAGRAPMWRPAKYDDGGHPLEDLEHVATRGTYAEGNVEVLDLGAGLLAQSENWKLASGQVTTMAAPAETGEDNA